MHQGGFVATNAQLMRAIDLNCLPQSLDTSGKHWAFGDMEAADSQLYYQCGFMKVVPIGSASGASGAQAAVVLRLALAEEATIHHTPDKYVSQRGIRYTNPNAYSFPLTWDGLLRWTQMCDSATGSYE
jgi:hypothetical protein